MRLKLRNILAHEMRNTEGAPQLLPSFEAFCSAVQPLLESRELSISSKQLTEPVQPLSPEEKQLYTARGLMPLVRLQAAQLKQVPQRQQAAATKSIISNLRRVARQLGNVQGKVPGLVAAQIESLERSGEFTKMLNDDAEPSDATLSTLTLSDNTETSSDKGGASKAPFAAFGAASAVTAAYLIHLFSKERAISDYLARATQEKSNRAAGLRRIQRAIEEKSSIAKQKKVALIALALGLAGTAITGKRLYDARG